MSKERDFTVAEIEGIKALADEWGLPFLLNEMWEIILDDYLMVWIENGKIMGGIATNGDISGDEYPTVLDALIAVITCRLQLTMDHIRLDRGETLFCLFNSFDFYGLGSKTQGCALCPEPIYQADDSNALIEGHICCSKCSWEWYSDEPYQPEVVL